MAGSGSGRSRDASAKRQTNLQFGTTKITEDDDALLRKFRNRLATDKGNQDSTQTARQSDSPFFDSLPAEDENTQDENAVTKYSLPGEFLPSRDGKLLLPARSDVRQYFPKDDKRVPCVRTTRAYPDLAALEAKYDDASPPTAPVSPTIAILLPNDERKEMHKIRSAEELVRSVSYNKDIWFETLFDTLASAQLCGLDMAQARLGISAARARLATADENVKALALTNRSLEAQQTSDREEIDGLNDEIQVVEAERDAAEKKVEELEAKLLIANTKVEQFRTVAQEQDTLIQNLQTQAAALATGDYDDQLLRSLRRNMDASATPRGRSRESHVGRAKIREPTVFTGDKESSDDYRAWKASVRAWIRYYQRDFVETEDKLEYILRCTAGTAAKILTPRAGEKSLDPYLSMEDCFDDLDRHYLKQNTTREAIDWLASNEAYMTPFEKINAFLARFAGMTAILKQGDPEKIIHLRRLLLPSHRAALALSRPKTYNQFVDDIVQVDEDITRVASNTSVPQVKGKKDNNQKRVDNQKDDKVPTKGGEIPTRDKALWRQIRKARRCQRCGEKNHLHYHDDAPCAGKTPATDAQITAKMAAIAVAPIENPADNHSEN